MFLAKKTAHVQGPKMPGREHTCSRNKRHSTQRAGTVGKGLVHRKTQINTVIPIFSSPYLLYNQSLLNLISSFKMSLIFSSFPLLFCCHHPSPDHQHAATLGLSSPAWCFKGFQNPGQPPYPAYSQTIVPHPPLHLGWAPKVLGILVSTLVFHFFEFLGLFNAPCFLLLVLPILKRSTIRMTFLAHTGNCFFSNILLHVLSVP